MEEVTKSFEVKDFNEIKERVEALETIVSKVGNLVMGFQHTKEGKAKAVSDKEQLARRNAELELEEIKKSANQFEANYLHSQIDLIP
jgi:heterodisulfide reductase subunit C